MWNKYITIESEKIKARQNADGTWVCSELKANSVKELDIMIGEVNGVLNKYNSKNKKKVPTPEKNCSHQPSRTVRGISPLSRHPVVLPSPLR